MEKDDPRWQATVERARLFYLAREVGIWEKVGDENSETFLLLDAENMKHVIRELGGDPDAKAE